MPTVNIYLTFKGNCEDAFIFYKSVFGGEFSYVGRFKDMPAKEGQSPCPPGDAEKIMHIGLPISKETILMGSDMMEGMDFKLIQGNNFSVSVTTHSQSEADLIFGKLSQGGKITMPIELQFWGDYFGMLSDKFGINWMVSFDTKANQ
jgi:PhnB protein